MSNGVNLQCFDTLGYAIYKDVFSSVYLDKLEAVLRVFHRLWCEENKDFFEHKAVNSAYLTRKSFFASERLTCEQRISLFNSIQAPELINIVEQYIPSPGFLNTQLFFDPFNKTQHNYWHRDIQYGQSDTKQQALLAETDPMPHFRIPLVGETGIELIPGSHNRWDTEHEYQVRMSQHNKRPHFDLANGKPITLDRGDLLVFSAKMLHRGIYGGVCERSYGTGHRNEHENKRFAFDVLFANEDSSYLDTVEQNCLPDNSMPKALCEAPIYTRTQRAIDRIQSSRV